LQTVVHEGTEKSILGLLIQQVLTTNIQEICVIVWPGDESRYAQAAGNLGDTVRFIPQVEPRGYGHAVHCAGDFVAGEPFLHMVSDHLYISTSRPGLQRLMELAETESCSASGVQPTRESLLPRFGAVAGRRVSGQQGIYRVETVIEKPTPTEAEQRLMVPGIRAGYYLCFFGIHVLTPTVMDLLDHLLRKDANGSVSLSAALAELARREQYLAVEDDGKRYDLGARYGLLIAQMALALSGPDRDEVLSRLLELFVDREMSLPSGGSKG
jgi:UTP--glucose-1-phosphate uridylyltransferase